LANAQKIGEEMFRRADIAKKQDIIANAQKIDADLAVSQSTAQTRTFKDVRSEAKEIGVDLSGRPRAELNCSLP